MIKTGIIGYGKWGKKLHTRLSQITEVMFICTSKDDYKIKLNKVDWVIVATPNITHYSIVKECIKAGKNIFCEKPLTPSFEQSQELFEMAEKYGVKLYVSDIQNYRETNFEVGNNNLIRRTKLTSASPYQVLFNLAYHDIYKLHDLIHKQNIKDIKIIDKKKNLHFKVDFEDSSYEFFYDLNTDVRTHNINGYDQTGDDDIILPMLSSVLNNEVNFRYNKKQALFTNKFIDVLKKNIFNKIAVVGGGIFGCTAAWYLSSKGYEVDLFEKNERIMMQASYVNQYRLHRGYHYPRSAETASSCLVGENSFLKIYGDSILKRNVKNYYCIASKGSLVNSAAYMNFLDSLGLDYTIDSLGGINEKSVDITVEVTESLFNPDKLRKLASSYLDKEAVNIHLNKEISIEDLEEYDYVVNSTYANLNAILPLELQVDYQFELCEKPVVKLSNIYRNKSVVIMDGPFMCIDPLGNTEYHVMGNVRHAIHTTNTGKFPIFDSAYDELLNKGIIKNPNLTNISKFISSASDFFTDIKTAQHIGSMFTIRTVLPNRDFDDARPTIVTHEGKNIFNLFSGKIGTCVDTAKELHEKISKL